MEWISRILEKHCAATIALDATGLRSGIVCVSPCSLEFGAPVADADECRARMLTYESAVTALACVHEGGAEMCAAAREHAAAECAMRSRVYVCMLPLCSPDGGYFIVRGLEKVVIAQERPAQNRLFVIDGGRRAYVYSIAHAAHDRCEQPRLFELERRDGGGILARWHGISKPLAVGIVDAALAGDEPALDAVGKTSDARGVTAADRIAHARSMLAGDVLPHLATADAKRAYLRYAVRQVMHSQRNDDRDHLGSKRVDDVDVLLAHVLLPAVRSWLVGAVRSWQALALRGRPIPPPGLILKHDIVTQRVRFALATGNWHAGRSGVAESRATFNAVAALSQQRRINTPLSRDSKQARPRQLHGTHWGFVCPAETPEGESCGLVRHLATGARLSSGLLAVDRERLVLSYVRSAVADVARGAIPVLVDGELAGACKDGHALAHRLRVYALAHVRPDVGIACVDGEVRVCSDRGRYVRGDDALDAAEEDNVLLRGCVPDHMGMRDEDFGNLLGAVASRIPFANRDQAPRITYQCQMAKQAVGVSIAPFLDTTSHEISYPQRSIVCATPDGDRDGCNAIVAIASLSGYNQEDSIIVSQAALERGLFRTMTYHTYRVPARKDARDAVDKSGKLDDGDGLPPVGGILMSGDQVMAVRGAPLVRSSARVDAVVRSDAGTHVRTREWRTPVVGDKFSSRHGQKGTIGIVVSQENMPFTARSGIVPDLIINPHAIPSRMTVGQLLETMAGKAAAALGFSRADAPAFTGPTAREIGDALMKVGYEPFGAEAMIDGETGTLMPALIFIGPVYYQRLRHMAQDKIHARARGPLTALTRQPVAGRAHDGGLRFGEMERDCVLAHGAAGVLRERTLLVSDVYRCAACENCGALTAVHLAAKVCKCGSRMHEIEIPYACKLLAQELRSMGVAMCFYPSSEM
jgi:DNA-directed RNA polymerase II subunit RPB2